MIWLIILAWIVAFVLCGVGIAILIRTGMADFEPWSQAKWNLIIAAILVTVPINVWAFHFQPVALTLILSLVVNSLAVLNFVMVVPDQWRRIVGKRR